MPSTHHPAPRPIRASRALAHPLWWVALALLLANDHLFKGAGVLPPALTGKLSDFAGLLVAPVVLAALVGVRGRRGWIAAHLAVGSGFAAINLSPAVARLVEAATLPTPFPWWITVDPSDLVALPMLAVSAAIFGAWCRRPVALRPAFARLGLALGGVACVATSPPPEEPPRPTDPWIEGVTVSFARARIALVNTTDGGVFLRTRTLRDSVAVDCEAIAADPALHLTPDLFGPVVVWSLERGSMLDDTQLDDARGRACRVVLVASERQTRLLFALDADFGVRELRYETGTQPSDPAQITIGGTPDAPAFADHRALFAPPTGEPIDPEQGACGLEPGAGLGWSEPPVNQGVLVGHGVGPDGCHALDIADRPWDPEGPRPPSVRWYVCAPGAPLDLPPGTDLRIFTGPMADGGAVAEITTPERTITLLRVNQINGTITGFDSLRVAAATADDACRSAWRDGCDGSMAPLVVRDGEGALPFGAPVRMSPDSVLTLIRAQQARVSDGDCDPWGHVGARFELVIETLTDDIAREEAAE